MTDDGGQEFAVFTQSSYSFDTHQTTTVWNVLNLTTGDVSLWTDDADISEVVFVGSTPNNIVYLNGTNAENNGGVSLYSADAFDLGSAQLIASLPAPLSGLKAVQTPSGDINFLLYGMADPSGAAYNAQTADTSQSTARLYNDIYVRHWVSLSSKLVRVCLLILTRPSRTTG